MRTFRTMKVEIEKEHGVQTANSIAQKQDRELG